MHVFVTGATGFIGSHFVNKCHDLGFKVTALRRSEFSRPRFTLSKEPRWLTGNMSAVTAGQFAGVDVLVHLAAHSMKPPYAPLEECLKYNVVEPLALFEQAAKQGIDKFVVTGSCFEYGTSGENYDLIPIDAPLNPVNTYAISKSCASMAFTNFAVQEKVKLIYNRLFHVYGEGEDASRLYPQLKKAAHKSQDFPMTLGGQIRDFTPVDHVVDDLIKSMDATAKHSFDPILRNVGTGNAQSLAAFAQKLWEEFDATGKIKLGILPYRENEVMRFVPEVKSFNDLNL